MSKNQESINHDVLQDMVASTDTGGRTPHGIAKQIIIWTAILWSLFQLYYASPIPYKLQGMINALGYDWLNVVVDETRARSVHLAFALFLAFLSYPAFSHSPKHRIPVIEWVFACVGAFLGFYYIIFYKDLVFRFGAPNMQDIIAGCCGIVLLLEAARRSLGLPLVVIASVFLLYNFFGEYMPVDWLISHKSGSLSLIINQQWVTTEGIFGVALGVSTKYVFLFVLFGSLLDKAGAGNYFIKTAFAYLGHLRGGPAKTAVIGSGLTGVISGSSIANVVTTGTFTIPMMKRVGFTSEKAGAVEVSSSVNGQIMPPVMGAAAFLMIEYVNMPYDKLITYAFLPAVISYIALVYVVHLEALKSNIEALPRTQPPDAKAIFLLKVIVAFFVIKYAYWGMTELVNYIKIHQANRILEWIGLILLGFYLLFLKIASRYPDLEPDDASQPVVVIPKRTPTLNSGLYYLLPVLVLVWCLMVERLSPALSAYWASVLLIFILLTRRPLLSLFRGQHGHYLKDCKQGLLDLKSALETGARNMIGIGIATATAGIIVGVVSLTGFGVQLSGVIEILSMGNLMLMLILVAIFSLILGMGLPTTANYIVVSSLMAAVVVELGRQNGLVVPLIAVHLFVFYFGIMADVTPPVGLASFAAAAISGGDPLKTGLMAFKYSLRTVVLPFLFIFNTDLILLDVTRAQGILIFVTSTLGILAFTAVTMNYVLVRNRIYESLLLLLAAFMLLNPDYLMKFISPRTHYVPTTSLAQALDGADEDDELRLYVSGLNPYGRRIQYYVDLDVIPAENGEESLSKMGLTLLQTDKEIEVEGKKYPEVLIDQVGFDSPAAKAGLKWDQVILSAQMTAKEYYAKEWMFIPGTFLIVLVYMLQYWRRARIGKQEEAVNG